MSPAPTLAAGLPLGEWVLEAPLGRGGFAEVWSARHARDPGRRAALKVPLDDETSAKLRNEGAIQSTIDSPHVVRVLEAVLESDPPFLALELQPGGSLRHRIEKGRLPEGDALAVARAILLALREAHARGIVHRDLKPENVLLGADGAAKVADFGLGAIVDAEARALLASGSLRTRDGRDLVGTIRYMSPEQREPGRAIDARADLYAWGVILFEMLTGEAPSGSEVPSEVVPEVDPRLDRIFRRSYARLEGRYASAAEALADVEAVLASPRPRAPDHVAALAARPVGPRAGIGPRALALAFDLAPFVAVGLETRSPRLALVSFLAYDALATLALGGSLGKRLLSLRVVGARDALPISPARALLRSAARFLSLGLLGLPALTALGIEKRALHDLVAGSAVAHDGP